MKHNIKNKKLNKTSSHRKALFMNMSNALIKHEQITTTLAKAKELRRFVEKIITLGKKGDLFSRRKTISTLQDEKMSKKVFNVLADRYKNRAGGYTRIIKKGNRCINIQIKTGIRCYNPKWSEDRWRAEIKRKDRKARRLNYDKKDCDFFIVKCRGYDAYYIFPYSCCKETNTVQLYPHRDKQVHQGFDAEPYKNAWELLDKAIET